MQQKMQQKMQQQITIPGNARWRHVCLCLLALVAVFSVDLTAPTYAGGEPSGASVEPSPSAEESPPQPPKVYELSGGWWWTGKTFKRKTLYSVGGVFNRRRPAHVDEVLEFGDQYLVPPFAEAHNHNFEGTYQLETIHRRYLERGIFYVKIANNIGELTAEIRPWFDAPGRLDVSFSNGGITATGGHPIGLYEKLILPRAHRGKTKEWLRNRAFFVVDDADDLKDVWPRITAQSPDFIKIFLLYSDEHAERLDDAKYDGVRGLDPMLVPLITRRAHRAGLRVASHVETAHDFRVALHAGVDEIMHLPGYQIPKSRRAEEYRLSRADARLAKRKGAVVVTTTALSRRALPDLERFQLIRKTLAYNLKVLHRGGVQLAIGSDRYEQTALDEVMTMKALDVFDNRTLLKLWCGTGKMIFPERRIGKLAAGYEASFLALEGNPIEDFQNVTHIAFRFKEGYPIDF